jgi:type I restriction enzyme S subunit
VPPKYWSAKYTEPVGPDTSELPLLPEGWCWASVDQLIREPLRNGHSARVVQGGNGVPTFSLSAVTNNDFSDENIKTTSADPKKVLDLWIETDDIFVQRSNTPELVGTTCRYKGEPGLAIFPDLLIRIRSTPLVQPAYVEIALQSCRCHAYFRRKAQGISGSMPKIDQQVVERAAVPLCVLAEQEAIVEAVEDQFSIIDHLEAKVKSAASLRQAILRHAFTGKLVPQDPNDEPASELLIRIMAEREARTREATTAKRAAKKAIGAWRRRPVKPKKKEQVG